MSMRSLISAAGALVLAASCAPRPAPPAPAPPPPAPRPEPAPPPAPAGWQDAPLSAGDWSYRREGAASSAEFGAAGAPQLAIRCGPDRQISIVRIGGTGSALAIRTSFG